MRAVIDTNVLVSGLFWHGAPHTLLAQVRAGGLTLVSSPALLAELDNVTGRAKFQTILASTNTSREDVINELRQLAELLEAPALPQPVCRDPQDDHALALALAAKVDVIISGDEDLLALGNFQGIPIVAPAKAVQMIAA